MFNIKNITTKKFFIYSPRFFSYHKFNHLFNQSDIKYTTNINPTPIQTRIPTFRCINLDGTPYNPSFLNIQSKLLNQLYRTMIKVQEIDNILYMSQRQGKISFYMTCFGQQATVIGSTAGLNSQDIIFPQYREQGSFIWRGYSIDQMINQCIGNHLDKGKGRQMPVHYGSKQLNIMTISSPLTTQVPHAAGAGYGFKLRKQKKIALTYFGQGAASQGDFHAAMNFAITLGSQTIFACRNNQYAISTNYTDQYRGDGIAGKALGYGMKTLRVDGNDLIACYQITKYARQLSIQNKQPVFIEFLTYRVIFYDKIGDHSTSDHSALYREQQQLESWKKSNNPIIRLGKYLDYKKIKQTTSQQDSQFRKQIRDQGKDIFIVINKLKKYSKQNLPPISSLFMDVYSQITPNLKQQKQSLLKHLENNKQNYELDKYQKE